MGFHLWVPVALLAALHYFLWISKDYRKRKEFWDELSALDVAGLHRAFDEDIARLIVFLSAKRRTRAQVRAVECALVRSTVLRELIVYKSGCGPLPTYLRSRRQVLALAKGLARKVNA